jgi:hypothetical protein
VTESADYVAHFQMIDYQITLSANPSEGGSVTGGGTYHYGDNCTVIASPHQGFNFVNWTIDGVPVYNNPTYSFAVTSDCHLVANFTTQSYVITALANPIEGGSVTGSGGYNYGDNCTLTASANMGYTFQNWTKNGVQVSYSPTYSFTVTESATYIANFTAQSYTIMVSATPYDGGTVSGGGTYTYGQSCTVHAIANTGYSFIVWTENGNQVSNQADYSFTVTGNRNLVANFTLEKYEITAETDPVGTGIITGTGLYHYGETATLSVEPFEDYAFLNWSENGDIISDELVLRIVVTAPHHFTANLMYTEGVGENVAPVEIFPNPANHILYIKGVGMRKITVFNILGQVMKDVEIEGEEQIQIDIQDFGLGFYILCIQTENGPVVKRIVRE